ncbi:hypothetical protein ANCDUO_08578 [Ancylostoma duodenale]|uniref:MEIS N-terminal domain-containing protein n=1 Tax=Ancylostoma duodenale TaxID=51022 RepID=A0A0C2CW61_9BILA|nr:hypothetical protein ANCDUO_08578 [Ancylostoma duodenale]
MGYPLPSQPGHPLAMGGTSPTAAGTSQTLPMQAVSSPSSSTCIRNDVTPQSGDTSMQQGANNGNPPSLDSISEAELCMSTAAGSRGGGLMDECLQHHQPGLLMDCTGYAGPSGQHRGGYEMYGDGSEFCQQVVVYPQHPSDPPQAGRDTPLRGGKAMAAQAKKRGIFPKPATNILRAWLFQHLTGLFANSAFIRDQGEADILSGQCYSLLSTHLEGKNMTSMYHRQRIAAIQSRQHDRGFKSDASATCSLWRACNEYTLIRPRGLL